MKLVMSLFLVMTLNTGCGVLKHSKNAAKSTDSAAQMEFESEPLELSNVLPAPSPWNLGGGQQFMVIGKFPIADLPAQFTSQRDVITQVGTLTAEWKYQNYPSETADATPFATKTEAVLNYQNIEVFVAKLDNDSANLGLVVRTADFAPVENKSEAVGVDYDYGSYCSRVTGTKTIHTDSGPFHFDQNLTLHAKCDTNKNCIIVDSGASNGQNLTYDWFFQNMNANCDITSSALRKHDNFQNTSTVEAFTINFNGNFQSLGASASFSTTPKP